MDLHLYNTLTRQKQPFEPIDKGRVTLYVCGPTVYNYIHIGNARPIVIFDTLYRLLKRLYPNVVYARNITDVDDKINAAAKQAGTPIQAISERFADAFHEDILQLNTLVPDVEPRATGHIQEMIEMINDLLDRGHAYTAEGHVLFHVPSMPDYGKLSRRNQEDLMAGARVEVASYKKNASDFILWKPSTEDLPGWDSPWGRGRPGWHIECSAMIKKHLGNTIDIHGGGQDLIFPHHENEMAQGCCAQDNQEFVRYWVHNGYLTIDGEKMSKSLGNFFTLREILEKFNGETVRCALLNAQYRSPLDWSEDALIQAKASLDRLYGALRDYSESSTATDIDSERLAALDAALCDDLNTPEALSVLHGLAHDINKCEDKIQKPD
ncbi:MAG: cysteine--tRNA ligase [Pseudomonadales bacterium]|nr:cysteine--tRNA ligase [Pseudomonadales bacterium]